MKLSIYVAPAIIIFLFGIFPAEWLNIYTRYPYMDKVMHNVPDDDIEHLVHKGNADNRYVVRINDDDTL